jgi:hypothetical protein
MAFVFGTGFGNVLVGHTVVINGTSRPELNGIHGLCVAYDASAGRFVVKTAQKGLRKVFRLRPENVRDLGITGVYQRKVFFVPCDFNSYQFLDQSPPPTPRTQTHTQDAVDASFSAGVGYGSGRCVGGGSGTVAIDFATPHHSNTAASAPVSQMSSTQAHPLDFAFFTSVDVARDRSITTKKKLMMPILKYARRCEIGLRIAGSHHSTV